MRSRLFSAGLIGLMAGLSHPASFRREMYLAEDGPPIPNSNLPTQAELDKLKADLAKALEGQLALLQFIRGDIRRDGHFCDCSYDPMGSDPDSDFCNCNRKRLNQIIESLTP